MSAPKSPALVAELLLSACTAIDAIDLRDAQSLAPLLTTLPRWDIRKLGDWLFGDDDAPNYKLIAHVVCRIESDRKAERKPRTERLRTTHGSPK